MAEKKDKHGVDELKKAADSIRDSYNLTVEYLYPSKKVKIKSRDTDIGKICQKWYKKIYDYSPNPNNDPELIDMVFLIDYAYHKNLSLDDKTTKMGKLWDMALKYHYELGKKYRVTMDKTKNELTRLGTRS